MNRSNDYEEFEVEMNIVMGAYGHKLSHGSLEVWWRALKRFDLEVVLDALERYVTSPRHGQYMPSAEHILEIIEATVFSRPAHGEAWAIATTKITDKEATVIWTDEIEKAWRVAAPLMKYGDYTGARSAFLDVYDRMINANRAAGSGPTWIVEEGPDEQRRLQAIREGVTDGRIAAYQGHPRNRKQIVVKLPVPKDRTAQQRLLRLSRIIRQGESVEVAKRKQRQQGKRRQEMPLTEYAQRDLALDASTESEVA